MSTLPGKFLKCKQSRFCLNIKVNGLSGYHIYISTNLVFGNNTVDQSPMQFFPNLLFINDQILNKMMIHFLDYVLKISSNSF